MRRLLWLAVFVAALTLLACTVSDSGGGSSSSDTGTDTGSGSGSGSGSGDDTGTTSGSGSGDDGDSSLPDHFLQVTVDGSEARVYDAEDEGTVLTVSWDRTSPDDATALTLTADMDTADMVDYTLTFNSAAEGAFTVDGSEASANIVDLTVTEDVAYTSDDGTYAGGSLNIATLGEVGEDVSGTFDLDLCGEMDLSMSDCGAGTLNFVGGFVAVRGEDTGSQDNPKDADPSADFYAHRILADSSNNFYAVETLDGYPYVLRVNSLSGDADIIPFGSDGTFTGGGSCDVLDETGNAGTVDDTCIFTADSAASYFMVTNSDESTVTYDLEVRPNEGTAADPLEITGLTTHNGQVLPNGSSYYLLTLTASTAYTISLCCQLPTEVELLVFTSLDGDFESGPDDCVTGQMCIETSNGDGNLWVRVDEHEGDNQTFTLSISAGGVTPE